MNKRTVLFGGCFDPPHVGHLLMAQWTSELLSAPVRFLPAARPVHKADTTAAYHRLAMLELALAGNPRFELDQTELAQDRPSYTYNTLLHFARAGVEPDQLFFVMGSDSLADIENWHNPEGIRALCTLVVYPRGEHRLQPRERGILVVPAPRIDISSSLVRQRVREGKSIRYMVPAAVEEYIGEKGLYRGGKQY